MGFTDKLPRDNLLLILAVVVVAISGHYLFFQFADYSYESPEHLRDFISVKLFSLGWLLFSILALYLLRSKAAAPKWAVFFVSAYFVGFYAILFRGTEYGLNGHLGDNAYRLAITCKMMAYSYFGDANVKSLTTFYPPLWFWAAGLYAKIVGIEAYQTVKFGYLMTFLIYPWLLYLAWRPLVSTEEAAGIAVAILFFRHAGLDYVPYEHVTAALFIPWWLYYFENAPGASLSLRKHWLFYLSGSVFGALLFMTYYWWFFMAFAALPVTCLVRWREAASSRAVISGLWQRFVLMSGVALFSAVYWFPLFMSSLKFGLVSNQAVWFSWNDVHVAGYWKDFLWDGIFVFLGALFLGYLWRQWKHTNLAYLFLGGILLVLLDRYLNLFQLSIQSRKFLEFTVVMALVPVALGVVQLWKKYAARQPVRKGLWLLLIIVAVTFCDNHSSQLFSSHLYSTGVNQRKPTAALAKFDGVDCVNAVFLTNKIYESCYLPFYKFVSTNNVGAHINERFQSRLEFLKKSSAITEPEYLAYMLAYNEYDTINYVYLPYNAGTGAYDLTVIITPFTRESFKDTISWSHALFADGSVFRLANSSGMYEVIPPERTAEVDGEIRQRYPALYGELR